MKKMMISCWRTPKDGGSPSVSVIEIAPDVIESFTRCPASSRYDCRTLSGDEFSVSEEIHDALIKAQDGFLD